MYTTAMHLGYAAPESYKLFSTKSVSKKKKTFQVIHVSFLFRFTQKLKRHTSLVKEGSDLNERFLHFAATVTNVYF